VEWIRLDPAREWLADVSCAQTELMLANQLQHSKDVHSQVHTFPYRQLEGCAAMLLWQHTWVQQGIMLAHCRAHTMSAEQH